MHFVQMAVGDIEYLAMMTLKERRPQSLREQVASWLEPGILTEKTLYIIHKVFFKIEGKIFI